MKTLVISLVLTLTAASATAGQVHLYGSGVISCGSWTQERRDNRWQIWNGMLDWSLGYISARSRTDSASLKQINADAVTSWLDQYCMAHPIEEIVAADDALFEAMKEP